MITRTFKLCLNAGTGSAPFINVSQTDKDEVWLFELYTETGERYIPSSGAIIGIKADGHGIANTGTVDSEGRVVITETEQMTAAAGRSIFELSIDGLTHGTANFIVNVEKKPIDGAIMSDSDLSLISQAVDSAAVIVDVIGDGDPSEVIGEHVAEWLDNHPEATTTVQDGAITSAKLNDSVKTGVFEDMTVGTSLAVWNDEGVTDNLAYKYRQTGADAVRELDEIVGGTIAWNQMVRNGDFATDTIWVYNNVASHSVASNTMTFTASAKEGYAVNSFALGIISGHKYLCHASVQLTTASNLIKLEFRNGSGFVSVAPTASTTDWQTLTGIVNGVAYANPYIRVIDIRESGWDAIKVKNVMVIDLTTMFGSTVADAIYAMEQSSAGSGVAYFRSLFPNAYYAYNSGELVSVEGLSAHETVGFNQWDEEWEVGWIDASTGQPTANSGRFIAKNFTKVFPSTTYYVFCGNNEENYVYQYDAEQNYLGYNLVRNNTITLRANAHYIKNAVAGASSYNHDICINISDPSKNGTYKPYTKHSYPLDSTLTLRGVPKWNNGLYYDGDIYRHDGSVSRRYGVTTYDGSRKWAAVSGTHVYYLTTNSTAFPYAPIATCNAFCGRYDYYGTATGSYSTKLSDKQFLLYAPTTSITREIAIRDDSCTDLAAFKASLQANPLTIVYELATPTSETAEPYQQYQICDGKGTEEYISTTVTPVGHNTFYPVDIVAKVNKLPSDFSTLIAPTEATFKATRNYTVNDLLIVNNVLYKVTANIATGSAITVNTNVQQTTLSALIKALS